jgi:anti-sigma B factor antagonist
MQYQVDEQSGYAVARLTGDVDLSTSPAVRKALLATLQEGKDLLIDLSEVTYLDSSGVAALVEAFQVARSKRLRFGLVGASSGALNVLRLARLDKVFPIHASVAERIQADG